MNWSYIFSILWTLLLLNSGISCQEEAPTGTVDGVSSSETRSGRQGILPNIQDLKSLVESLFEAVGALRKWVRGIGDRGAEIRDQPLWKDPRIVKLNGSYLTSSTPRGSAGSVGHREYRDLIITRGADGQDPDPAVTEKREFIKRMMKDAWSEYERYAWGQNELMPLSRRGRDGGHMYGNQDIGATIIDSLGTLYIMGFEEEFKRARDWIKDNFDFQGLCNAVSLFETNIRVVGGFLSAYALTNDTMFLSKAKEVADALLPAFDSPSGIPYPRVTPCRKAASGTQISLAELGSLHLEFTYLIVRVDWRSQIC